MDKYPNPETNNIIPEWRNKPIPRILTIHRPINRSTEYIDFSQENSNSFNLNSDEVLEMTGINATNENRSMFLKHLYNTEVYQYVYKEGVRAMIHEIQNLAMEKPDDQQIQNIYALFNNFAIQYNPEDFLDYD